jgi:hypothetical protein
MFSSRRISASDSLLVVLMAARAFSASSSWFLMTKCPTPACTAMTLIEWATTSCSSRAIRSRSSWTVARAYRSLYAARERIARPIAHPAPMNAASVPARTKATGAEPTPR